MVQVHIFQIGVIIILLVVVDDVSGDTTQQFYLGTAGSVKLDVELW